MLTDMTGKGPRVRQNRLRRMAARQGMTATKIRRMDERAIDYGYWSLTWTNGPPLSEGYSLTEDELERWLLRDFALYRSVVEQMAAERGGPVSEPESVRRYLDLTAPTEEERAT
jgi:hypothetical protein